MQIFVEVALVFCDNCVTPLSQLARVARSLVSAKEGLTAIETLGFATLLNHCLAQTVLGATGS